ncbi:hypothetical protein DRQ09_10725 [candidate division KSB1 bacterium]|nr:MAG: hypothetical protein DRQ09_10725 [candidate division KSB1 bacterium]
MEPMIRDKIRLLISIIAILFFFSGFLIQGWGIVYLAPVFFLWAGIIIFFKGNLLEKLFRSSVLAGIIWFLLFPGLFSPNPLKYPSFIKRSFNISGIVEPSHSLVSELSDAFNKGLPQDISEVDRAIMVESFVDEILKNKTYFNLLGVVKYVPTVSELLCWGAAQSEKNLLGVSILKNLGYDNCYLTFGFPFGSYPHTWITLYVERKKFELGTPDHSSNYKLFSIDEKKVTWIKSPGKVFTSSLFMDYPVNRLTPVIFLVLFLVGLASTYWDGSLNKKLSKAVILLIFIVVISFILLILFNVNVFYHPEISELQNNIKIAKNPFFYLVLACWIMTFFLSRFSKKLSKKDIF